MKLLKACYHQQHKQSSQPDCKFFIFSRGKEGHRKQEVCRFKERDMGLPVFLRDDHHSRKFSSVINTHTDLQSRQDKALQNGNRMAKFFSTSAKYLENQRYTYLHLVSHTVLHNTLHGCQTYSVRAQMQCNKFGQKNYCLCFPFLSDKPYTSKSKRLNRKK